MERMIGQAEVVGRIRHRRHHAGSLVLPYPRTSRIFVGITDSGDVQPLPVSKVKGLSPSDYPHLERGAEALLGMTVKPAWTTVRKRKTTIGGYSVKDTGYRQEKKGGFGSANERKKVKKIRRDKELRRRLFGTNISKNQLFFLIHFACHSQTLLEKKAPIRSLPRHKQGGFVSQNEVKIMGQQRRRNKQRLASHGTIYRY